MRSFLSVYKNAVNGTLLKRNNLPPITLEEAWENLATVMSRFGEKQLAACSGVMYSHVERRMQRRSLITDIAAGRKTLNDIILNCGDIVGLSDTELVIA